MLINRNDFDTNEFIRSDAKSNELNKFRFFHVKQKPVHNLQERKIMPSNAMDAILIAVAFLTIGVNLERNILFVSSATVALRTSADTKPTTTSNDYAQTTTTTTTDRYPKLYAENDNYGKQTNREQGSRETYTF